MNVDDTLRQTPFFTTALNRVEAVSAADVYVVTVFVIFVQLLYGVTELCHLTTVPACPLNVSKSLALPVQTDEPPLTEPPTVVESIFQLTVIADPLSQ